MAATDADRALAHLGREVLAEVLANAVLLEQGREGELLELSWVRPFQRFERGRMEQVRGYSTMRQPGMGWIPEPDWLAGQRDWIADGEAIWKAHEWKPDVDKGFTDIGHDVGETKGHTGAGAYSLRGPRVLSEVWDSLNQAQSWLYNAKTEAGEDKVQQINWARAQLMNAHETLGDAIAVSTNKRQIKQYSKLMREVAGHIGQTDLAAGVNPATTLGGLRTPEEAAAGLAHRAALSKIRSDINKIMPDVGPRSGNVSQGLANWRLWEPVRSHLHAAASAGSSDPGQAYHELLAAHQLLAALLPEAQDAKDEQFISGVGDAIYTQILALDKAMGADTSVTDALGLQDELARAVAPAREIRALRSQVEKLRDATADTPALWLTGKMLESRTRKSLEDARQQLESGKLVEASASLGEAYAIASQGEGHELAPSSNLTSLPNFLAQIQDARTRIALLLPVDDAGAVTEPGSTISGMTGGVTAGALPGDTLSGSAFADLPPAEIPPSQMPMPELRPILASEVAGTNSREVNLPEYLMLAQQGKALLDRMGRTSRPLWYDSLQYVSVEAHKQGGPDYRPEERASEDAWQATRQEWGGATIDAHTGRVLPQGADKYALSVKPQGELSVSIPITSGKQQFSKAFDYASKKFSPLLTLDNHYLGVFRDEDAGRIDFDPVVVVDTAAEAEAIGTYTHAIGGAYHFQDGRGLFPPHLPDPEIAKMAIGDLPTPLHTVERYLSRGGVVAERMSDGGWRWQGRSSPDWHQMSESAAASMPAEVAPGGIWQKVRTAGTPTGAAQRFGTASVGDFTFTGPPDLAQIPRDIVDRYVPPGLLGVLSQTKMGGVQLSFRALDQFSAAQDAKWLGTDATGKMLLKSSAAFYTTWDNRVEVREPYLRGDTGTQAILHETGHALDYALASPSEGEDFANLLHAILADPQSNAGDYYKAPREAWAEMFASHMRDDPAVSRGMQFSDQSWRNVQAYFRKLGIYTGQQEADVRSRELGDQKPLPLPKSPRRAVLSSPKPLEGYDLWVGSTEGRTSVSERDAQAARHVWYSYNYNKTNSYLRTGHSTYGKVNAAYAEDISHFVRMINSAPPFTKAATVYRGVEDGEDLFGPVGSKIGQQFTDKGLVSTSANEYLAMESYAPEDMDGIRTVVRLTLAPGVRALKSSRDFWVEPGMSALDQQYGRDAHERHQEYTLPPGTTFVVTSDGVTTTYNEMGEPVQVRYVDVEVVTG